MKKIVVLSVVEVLTIRELKIGAGCNVENDLTGRKEFQFHPYQLYLGEAMTLQRQLLERYGISADFKNADTIILISPICKCCDHGRALESAARKLQEQNFQGKVLTWQRGDRGTQSLEDLATEAEVIVTSQQVSLSGLLFGY